MDPAPDSDTRNEPRQALDLHQPSEMGEALEASGVRRQRPLLHSYCTACGLPFSQPQTAAVCASPEPCAKRLEAPVDRRLKVGRSLAVDQRWLADHPEAS
jgi:hypothetical protein